MGPGADSAQIRTVLDSVANGSARSVEDIAAQLGRCQDVIMRGVELVEALKRKGVVTREQVARWESVSGLLAVLDAMGKDGATALVKVDGARAAGLVYTVLVSGGRLAHDVVFRKDGADLPPLLREAIAFYEGEVWSKDGERSVGKEGGRLKW